MSLFVVNNNTDRDDARGLNGLNGAPTVGELKLRVESEFPGGMVEVKCDILRIAPQP